MNKHEGSRKAHKSKKNANVKAILDLRGRYWVQGAHVNVCHIVPFDYLLPVSSRQE